MDCERLCGKGGAEFHSGAGLLNGDACPVTGKRNGSVGRHGRTVRYPLKGFAASFYRRLPELGWYHGPFVPYREEGPFLFCHAAAAACRIPGIFRTPMRLLRLRVRFPSRVPALDGGQTNPARRDQQRI